jgi:isopropylmalate/homocitrate/citramalate synthase
VAGTIYGLNHYADFPSEWLEWHGHDDFYKALINSATAWLYGCSAVNATVLGVGERTGNAPLEGLVMEYLALRGHDADVDTTVITELARYMRDVVRYEIPPRQPFVGAHFNTTLAGIHADALEKDKRIYSIFDTERLLGVSPGIRVSDKSGRAGIAYWINLNLELADEDKTTKSDPGVEAMCSDVAEQYAKGRVAVISDQELLQLVIKHIPRLADKARPKLP